MSDRGEDHHQDIVTEQKTHFKQLYRKNKGHPNAVASETYEHKKLRYQKITEIFPNDREFSIYEVGYGLGHFYEFIEKNFDMDRIAYSGSEIVEEYYNHCTETHNPTGNFELRNILEDPPAKNFDYVIMSGVFHQIGDTSRSSWKKYMHDILEESYKISTEGIAFNFLSQKVDYKKEGNYYADINDIMDFTNQNLSRFFELRHNYPLYEATMFVYHPEYISEEYPEEEFQKYL